jgi:hypothetical protein
MRQRLTTIINGLSLQIKGVEKKNTGLTREDKAMEILNKDLTLSNKAIAKQINGMTF